VINKEKKLKVLRNIFDFYKMITDFDVIIKEEDFYANLCNYQIIDNKDDLDECRELIKTFFPPTKNYSI